MSLDRESEEEFRQRVQVVGRGLRDTIEKINRLRSTARSRVRLFRETAVRPAIASLSIGATTSQGTQEVQPRPLDLIIQRLMGRPAEEGRPNDKATETAKPVEPAKPAESEPRQSGFKRLEQPALF